MKKNTKKIARKNTSSKNQNASSKNQNASSKNQNTSSENQVQDQVDLRRQFFLERAAAFYDEMNEIAANAPHGEVVNNAESYALIHANELIRQSLESVVQERMEDEKKKDDATCSCGGKYRHRGYVKTHINSSYGKLSVRRVRKECRQCLMPYYPVDSIIGLEKSYTRGARRLAVLAGTSWSFDKASELLEEFCGLKLSDNTIRSLCQKEAIPMGRWTAKCRYWRTERPGYGMRSSLNLEKYVKTLMFITH